jgi:hypothetical protein
LIAQSRITTTSTNDTLVEIDIQSYRILAKVCSDRAYLIAVNRTLVERIKNDSIIMSFMEQVANNNDSIQHAMSNIIVEQNNKEEVYRAVIKDKDATIKKKNKNLVVHKVIIGVLAILAILK